MCVSGAAPQQAPGATAAAPGAPATSTPDTSKQAASVSTVISLLSTLCRGSPSITHVCITSFTFSLVQYIKDLVWLQITLQYYNY